MLVSIIIPVYNSEHTIERAIKSVISQDSNDIELIVVDGKSTDDTFNIIQDYAQYTAYALSEPDEGYADAFNKGIVIAKGDFVMMLAADDYLLPGAIDKFRLSLKAGTEVWCGSIIQKMTYGYSLRKSNPDLDVLRTRCSLENAATFYKRELIIEHGYFNVKYKCAADREMFLRLYLNGVRFQIEEVPMVVFEMGGLSTFNPEKYAIPEDEAISVQYGLDERKAKEATFVVRRVLYKEKVIAPIKKFFASIGLLVLLYKIFGKRDVLLSKSRLRAYGVLES